MWTVRYTEKVDSVTSTTQENPGLINSSYVMLFHIAIALTAPFVTHIFPTELRGEALMIAIVFPILLFWFSYALKQFISTSVIMMVIFAAAYVIALMSVLNAMYGHLSNHVVPLLATHIFLFDNLLAGLSGPPGIIYAGTVLTYGAYVYLFGLALANVAEGVYSKFISPHLPRFASKILIAIDSRIDSSATQVSDKFFVFHQAVGALICLGLLAMYALLYAYLLIR